MISDFSNTDHRKDDLKYNQKSLTTSKSGQSEVILHSKIRVAFLSGLGL